MNSTLGSVVPLAMFVSCSSFEVLLHTTIDMLRLTYGHEEKNDDAPEVGNVWYIFDNKFLICLLEANADPDFNASANGC